MFIIIFAVLLQLINKYAVNGYAAPGYCYSLDKDKSYASHFASKSIYPLPTDESAKQLFNITGINFSVFLLKIINFNYL